MILPFSINEFMYGTKKRERGEHLCSLPIQRIMQSVAVLKRMDFGRFYIILKVNLAENSYECIYSHNRGIYDDVKTAGTYDDFLKVYCEKYVCEKLQEFLKSDSLTEHLKKGCSEEDIVY